LTSSCKTTESTTTPSLSRTAKVRLAVPMDLALKLYLAVFCGDFLERDTDTWRGMRGYNA
jgi:hypothetical protein